MNEIFKNTLIMIMIVITQQFVLTLFRNNVLERIQVTVWTTVKKLASTTFI